MPNKQQIDNARRQRGIQGEDSRCQRNRQMKTGKEMRNRQCMEEAEDDRERDDKTSEKKSRRGRQGKR